MDKSIEKAPNKKYLFFFIFNQSKIQFETLEQDRLSEKHLTHHL